jgi:hypothetical protein
MYLAEQDNVYYCNPDENGKRELFLTVHPTDNLFTVEEVAIKIADILNAIK